MPTIKEQHTQLPGEVVLDNPEEAIRAPYAGLAFTVRKLTAGIHFPADSDRNLRRRDIVFEAATPYRGCVYQGDTCEQAIGRLLLGVAILSREGSFDPHHPESNGTPIIQHAMTILTERMVWQLARRREHLDGNVDPNQMVDPAAVQAVARDNEIVSALGTAVAALARVKDL